MQSESHAPVLQGIRPAALQKVVSQDLAEFVSLCICPIGERPHARQLLKHPYFDSIRQNMGALKLGMCTLAKAGGNPAELISGAPGELCLSGPCSLAGDAPSGAHTACMCLCLLASPRLTHASGYWRLLGRLCAPNAIFCFCTKHIHQLTGSAASCGPTPSQWVRPLHVSAVSAELNVRCTAEHEVHEVSNGHHSEELPRPNDGSLSARLR